MRFLIRTRAFRWLGDRRGAAAVIMAICAPVLMLMIGFAIDYGYALNINQRLNAAADAAVLTATSPSATAQAGGIVPAAVGCNGGGTSCWSWNRAIFAFLGNEANLPQNMFFVPTISINTVGNKVTATATYSGSVPTFFSGIVGMPTIPISGHAQATATALTYVNYYILLDISNSMGIGASSSDQTALFNATVKAYGPSNGCQFGCHVADPYENQTESNEKLAHDQGITLRIDSAKTAISEVINTAATLNTNGNIQIGIYTMNQDPNNPTGSTVTVVQDLTTNQSALLSAVNNIELGNNLLSGGSSYGDSNFNQQFIDFKKNVLKVSTNGTGLTPTSPLNYVLIVTDGVSDANTSPCSGTYTTFHCVSILNPTLCTPLQAASTVGVLYTTYDTIWYNPNNPTVSANPSTLGYTGSFYGLVYPLSPDDINSAASDVSTYIANQLQACATSSQYFLQADQGSEIESQMQALFANTLQSARLTQ